MTGKQMSAIQKQAATVCRAWGFTPRRFIVWEKSGFGLGTFPRPQHELILFAQRGMPKPKRRDIGSVQRWGFAYEKNGRAGSRRHSAKPIDSLAMVEAAFDGPYLELFARAARLGWSSWGNEVASSFDLYARDRA